MPNIEQRRAPRMLQEVEDWFEQMRPRWFPSLFEERGEEPARALAWPFRNGPAVDLVEEDDAVRVTAELPGLEKEDFSIEVDDNRVVLTGEKRQEKERKEKNYVYSERTYGSFSRVIPLPCEVDRDKATASFKNGVLTIELPKTAEAKSHRKKIEVK